MFDLEIEKYENTPEFQSEKFWIEMMEMVIDKFQQNKQIIADLNKLEEPVKKLFIKNVKSYQHEEIFRLKACLKILGCDVDKKDGEEEI